MSNETIADLRAELFATLRGLTDKTNPMEIERAKAVSDIAQTIINSAKVEVEHMKVAGGKGSGFIPEPARTLPGIVEQRPGLTVRRHKLEG